MTQDEIKHFMGPSGYVVIGVLRGQPRARISENQQGQQGDFVNVVLPSGREEAFKLQHMFPAMSSRNGISGIDD